MLFKKSRYYRIIIRDSDRHVHHAPISCIDRCVSPACVRMDDNLSASGRPVRSLTSVFNLPTAGLGVWFQFSAELGNCFPPSRETRIIMHPGRRFNRKFVLKMSDRRNASRIHCEPLIDASLFIQLCKYSPSILSVVSCTAKSVNHSNNDTNRKH